MYVCYSRRHAERRFGEGAQYTRIKNGSEEGHDSVLDAVCMYTWRGKINIFYDYWVYLIVHLTMYLLFILQ